MEVIKIKANTYKDYTKKLRVCGYARVSTEMERQETSYESQQFYYEQKIKNNPNWIFVRVYSDRGISGLSIEKRDGFNRMIKDAQAGKIDLILTKSISRFARNTLDTLKTIRLLRNINVYVYFEEEMISTASLESELILTALSAVAQMESEVTSNRIQMARKMKREMLKPTIFRDYYGYKRKKHELTINKKEAKIVSEVFNRVINKEQFGFISKDLNQRKIKFMNKGWYPSTVKRMVQNRIYIGEYNQSVDKWKNKNLSDGTWELHTFIDHHEPIVSKEIFDEANKVIEELGNKQRDIIPSPFHSKVFCGYCKGRYRKKRFHKDKPDDLYWKCNRNHYKEFICNDSAPVPDKLLRCCFQEMIKKISKLKDGKIKKYESDIELLEEQLNYKLQKYSTIVDSFLDKRINHIIYKNKCDGIQEKIKTTREDIQLLKKINEKNKTKNEILRYIKSISQYYNVKEFSDDLFEVLISKIIIGGYSKKGYKDKYMITFILNNETFEFENIKNELVLEMKVKYDLAYLYYEKNKRIKKQKKSFNVKLELENDER